MANTTRTVRRQAPAASSTGTDWVDPIENPGEANDKISRILGEANSSPLPEIPFPADDTVALPGGLVRKDTVIRSVQVKELTGEDEETLARASQSMNPYLFLDRLIKCGVTQIGDEPSSEKDNLVSQMLIGDREAVILGIRKATYGDKIEVPEWTCPNCGSKMDLSMELGDIPFTKMDDPANEVTFKVKLRKGGFALVKLASGADQLFIYDKPELTNAQRETLLLTRCVISITNSAGKEMPMAAFPSMALEMSMPDRHAILRQLSEKQPGPKYNKVRYTCENCNSDEFVAVTIGHLFLDSGWA